MLESDFDQMILDGALGGVVITTTDRTIVRWSKGAERIFGYRSEEAVGCKLWDLISLPEQEQADARIAQALDAHGWCEHESLRRRKDGEFIYVEASCELVGEPGSSVRYIISSKKDTTSRKALRDGQFVDAKFRVLLEAMPDSVIMVNATGHIVLTNSQADHLFGYASGELQFKKIDDLLPQRFRYTHVGHRARFFDQPRKRMMGADLELYGVRKDGVEFPVEISLSPIHTDVGSLVISAIRDVSERRRAEQKFRGLLESAPDAIIIANENGEIVLVNTQAEHLFGHQRKTLIGKHIEFLIPARFAAAHVKHRGGFSSEPRPRSMGAGLALYGLHQDGTEFPVEISLSPLETEDGMLISSAIRDISERKRTESILNDQKVALERANQAKDKFLTSMSHELRTPLNAVLGFAQLLANESLPSTALQKHAFVENIVSAGKHLLTLINEILDLAKIESGSLSLSIEPVALDALMAEVRIMVEEQAQRRGIQLVFAKCEQFTVRADHTRLKQVILNLLSNAIKYNRVEGVVVVKATQHGAGHVRISVQDTGNGMDAEQLDALFQPFNRLGQEAGSEEGTGIGLVVTKRLIELMNGSIGVSSAVGVGSVFWIALETMAPIPSPIAPAITAPSALPLGDAVPSGPAVLLYVEDNPASLRLVEEIIGFRTDLSMISASDGRQGVALAKEHLPQVILMDINLPGLNGNQAQYELKNDPSTAHIPVIALTANAMKGDIKHGLAAGFFRYLTKPVNVEALNSAIDDALNIAISRSAPPAA